MCEAGIDGLSKDELPKRSKHTGAIEIITRLVKLKDPRWKSVIQMAGTSWGRYRVL
jgi:hypothetical protein